MKFAQSLVPAWARRWYETKLGKRFGRFIPVALAALIASQLTLALLVGLSSLPGWAEGGLAAMVGAAVSYVLSRIAWERKGKPSLLRETLPFAAVSVCAWIVLALATKYFKDHATAMGLVGLKRVAFVEGGFFAANCGTFLARFLIFHYVLFADRGTEVPPSPATEPLGSLGTPDAKERAAR